jgi:hypothetical protein
MFNALVRFTAAGHNMSVNAFLARGFTLCSCRSAAEAVLMTHIHAYIHVDRIGS